MGYTCVQAISLHLLISSSNFNKVSIKNNQTQVIKQNINVWVGTKGVPVCWLAVRENLGNKF